MIYNFKAFYELVKTLSKQRSAIALESDTFPLLATNDPFSGFNKFYDLASFTSLWSGCIAKLHDLMHRHSSKKYAMNVMYTLTIKLINPTTYSRCISEIKAFFLCTR